MIRASSCTGDRCHVLPPVGLRWEPPVDRCLLKQFMGHNEDTNASIVTRKPIRFLRKNRRNDSFRGGPTTERGSETGQGLGPGRVYRSLRNR